MKQPDFKRIGLITASVLTLSSLTVVPVTALQAAPGVSTTGSSTPSTNTSGGSSDKVKTTAVAANQAANQAAHITTIKQRATTEINRRLATLNGLVSKINAAPNLSATDKSSLLDEVNSEIAGLTTLQTTINNDTDLTTLMSDAQSIITEYRVYALLVPKIALVIAADNQLAIEAKLTTLAGKLQTFINTAQSKGTNVTAQLAALSDMNAKITAAQGISSSVQAAVIGLQPTDYNTNHGVLEGYRNQLKTARTDIGAALSDAHQIAPVSASSSSTKQ